MTARKIKVLVVDDSALMRKLISGIVSKDPDIEVVDTAINGLFAMKKIKQQEVDLILLDIEMPGMNGFEFLEMKKELGIDIPVVMLSSLGATRPKVTMKALDLGAKDFIIKPSGSISMDIETVGHEIVAAVKRYGGAKYKTEIDTQRIDRELEKIVAHSRALEADKVPARIDMGAMVNKEIVEDSSQEKRLKKVQMILIGISTGGPAALRHVIPQLKGIKKPILIVQHMPPGFTEEFARGMDRISSLEVKEAEEGDVLRPGWVYIARGDRHLSFHRNGSDNVLQLLDTPPVNGHRPSVEVLFETASIKNIPVLAIIMTGMGKDGAHSINKLHAQGNYTLAQSPQDCVVFGMPKVAIELGGIDKVLMLDDMAEFINMVNQKYF